MKPKTIKIESNVPEDVLMEILLNMKHSGVNRDIILFTFSIHALANTWHIDKVNYYLKLLGEGR